VVLLDLEMPVMDGYTAAAKLRELEREGGRKRCSIIAISSNDEEAIVRRARAAGCDQYLVKPAPRDTLLRLLSDQPAEAPAREAAPASADDAVELDADLEPTLAAFLASRRQGLDEMGSALASNDRAVFRRLAHKLAGSFSLYGFAWAALQCRALEKAGAAGDVGDLARGADALRAHLDTVKIRLRTGETK
jgi:CheY-like chemotaxis protein